MLSHALTLNQKCFNQGNFKYPEKKYKGEKNHYIYFYQL